MTQTTHPAAYTKRYKRRRSPRPNPYAICQVIGRSAVLVNAAIPAGYDQRANTCPKCHMVEYRSGQRMPIAYAHKRNSRGHCDECEGDRIAMIGIALERQGIVLGWGVADHSNEYERESHQQYRAR